MTEDVETVARVLFALDVRASSDWDEMSEEDIWLRGACISKAKKVVAALTAKEA